MLDAGGAPMTTTMPTTTPDRIFDLAFSFQRTGALKAGVDLDLFTAIDDGVDTAVAIAARSQASQRGIRILCDFLTVNGLLTKAGDRYALTPEASAFLSKRSPTYLGSVTNFLAS